MEYQKVQEKARTSQYQQTRRTHPKIERKLGEVVRHQQACGGRPFAASAKVLLQAVLTTLAVNRGNAW